MKVNGNEVSMEEVLDMLFDKDTGLTDPDNNHHGIVPEYNQEAIQSIEDGLGWMNGTIEMILQKSVKINLVVLKQRTNKHNHKYDVYFRVDPNYKKDNTEQLRKVNSAIDRFKNRFETL